MNTSFGYETYANPSFYKVYTSSIFITRQTGYGLIENTVDLRSCFILILGNTGIVDY
jgi:hypothetical protein